MKKFKGFDDPEFQKLRKEWYQKLKNDGFKDIESFDYPDGLFIDSNFDLVTDFENKVDYFRFAAQFLQDHKFKNKTYKKIWELHANGARIREIAKEIKMSPTPVFYRLKEIKKDFRKYITKIDDDLLTEKEISMKFKLD